MNDKITEIKEALAEVETNGYVYGDVYREDASYLLQQLEEQTKRAETAIKANTLLVMGNSDLISKNHQLHAQVEMQSEVLEFYADPDSWRLKHIKGNVYFSAVHEDTGEKAREALSII